MKNASLPVVACPTCKAEPYAKCRDHYGVPMHLKHNTRRRKAFAVRNATRKRAA